MGIVLDQGERLREMEAQQRATNAQIRALELAARAQDSGVRLDERLVDVQRQVHLLQERVGKLGAETAAQRAHVPDPWQPPRAHEQQRVDQDRVRETSLPAVQDQEPHGTRSRPARSPEAHARELEQRVRQGQPLVSEHAMQAAAMAVSYSQQPGPSNLMPLQDYASLQVAREIDQGARDLQRLAQDNRQPDMFEN